MKRIYRIIPDPPDGRDFFYRISRVSALPPVSDLRPRCTPVEDQGQLGSCTGNAIVGALECIESKKIDLSRLFVYFNEREVEGTINEDAGAIIRDGIKSIARQGVCTEKLWPYDISRFKERPSPPCYTDALKRKISRYERIVDIDGMRDCLAKGSPVVFGIKIFSSFEGESVSRTGVVPMPRWWERTLGGHALCAVGYSDSKQWLIVRNSWGEGWGDKGYCYIPYKYMQKYASDIWRIEK
jgi:C1A family cysteine protease